MHLTGCTMTCVIGLTLALSGCSQSSGLPGSPSPPPVVPTPSKAAPVVTDVLPSVGSAAGGATIKIVGTGFRPGMIAMFDGIKVTGTFDTRDASFTTFYSETPAHAVGAVDLTVTNPDGQSHRVAAGYTYAPQDSFDPNGVWGGFSLNGTDTWVEFVIEANRLVSASCMYDFSMPFTLSTSATVHGGEFSVTEDGGATVSGRIVSASEILGTISFPPCTTTPLPWRASRTSH
jgi:IPT/TIG domain